MGYHYTRDRLTPENLLELDPRKDQLGMGRKQILQTSWDIIILGID